MTSVLFENLGIKAGLIILSDYSDHRRLSRLAGKLMVSVRSLTALFYIFLFF